MIYLLKLNHAGKFTMILMTAVFWLLLLFHLARYYIVPGIELYCKWRYLQRLRALNSVLKGMSPAKREPQSQETPIDFN